MIPGIPRCSSLMSITKGSKNDYTKPTCYSRIARLCPAQPLHDPHDGKPGPSSTGFRNRRRFYAIMDVSHEGLHYRFESPGWLSHEKCHQQIDEIQELLDGQNGICIFAADIPSEEGMSGTEESNSSAWVFYGIKTLAGRLSIMEHTP